MLFTQSIVILMSQIVETAMVSTYTARIDLAIISSRTRTF